MNTIYDYALKVNVVDSVAPAGNDFLKVPLVIVKPKEGYTETDKIVTVTSKAQLADITANANTAAVFDGGISKVLVIAAANLGNINTVIAPSLNEFYTIIISKDFTDEEVAEFEPENFKGVVFSASEDKNFASERSKAKNKGVYYKDEKNMFYAFGKLLSAVKWNNLQYEGVLTTDGIAELSEAENLFNERVSFSLTDSQSVNRLAFFAAGGESIIAPYVLKEIEIKLQSETINWIRINTPQYTQSNCSILGEFLQTKVIDKYAERGLITEGRVEITTDGSENFIASGTITVPSPTALWRVQANLYNTIL